MSIFEGLSPPYSTIVADPPWRYNATKGLPTRGFKPSTAEAHYSTMSMAEIAAMPVAELADTDAHIDVTAPSRPPSVTSLSA